MKYLEPGRKRRHRWRPGIRTLWLIAAGMAVALAVQAIIR